MGRIDGVARAVGQVDTGVEAHRSINRVHAVTKVARNVASGDPSPASGRDLTGVDHSADDRLLPRNHPRLVVLFGRFTLFDQHGTLRFKLRLIFQLLLELIALEDVTPIDDESIDVEGQDALEKVIRKGSRFDFSEYGIPVGAVLQHAQSPEITCLVEDDQTVNYRGESMSLSRAAGQANLDRGGRSTSFAGPRFWVYEGETLSSRRERLEEDQ